MDTDAVAYVVDADDATRELVTNLAGGKGLPTKSFATAKEFLAAYEPERPGCLVVDLQLPDTSGLELLEELKRRKQELPAVVLTSFADVPTAVRAMQAGAVTILEKPSSDAKVWEALQQARDISMRQFGERRYRAEVETRLATLSEEELSVLKRLIEGQPNKMIASDLDIGLRTVELRRSNVMRKMQATSLPDLVRMALAAGLLSDSLRQA